MNEGLVGNPMEQMIININNNNDDSSSKNLDSKCCERNSDIEMEDSNSDLSGVFPLSLELLKECWIFANFKM